MSKNALSIQVVSMTKDAIFKINTTTLFHVHCEFLWI